jgi:hypothetical protein
MSGKRCKALRDEFDATYGRPPRRAQISKRAPSVPIVETAKPAKRSWTHLFKFFGRVREVLSFAVAEHSEIRRWRKAAGDAHEFEAMYPKDERSSWQIARLGHTPGEHWLPRAA